MKKTQWDEYLQQVMTAYCASVNFSTGKIPNMMTLGRKPVLPMQAIIDKPTLDDDDDSTDMDDYLSRLRTTMLRFLITFDLENLLKLHPIIN